MDAEGAIHHVMIRGVEKRSIFADDRDREDFLGHFEYLAVELGFACHAWALISNHVHLVVQTGHTPLASMMSRLNSRHAQRFNRRNARVGHLLQDRYKATRVEDDAGLARAVAYVPCARRGDRGDARDHGGSPRA